MNDERSGDARGRSMVADALEMDEALLDDAAELLADLDALGSDPEWIAEVIAELPLPPEPRILDLCCGKGAVAEAIADAVRGAVVHGVDLHPALIAAARERPGARGSYEVGDATDLPRPSTLYDVALIAAVGDVLGGFDVTARLLREQVRPGGWLVIADVWVDSEAETMHPLFAEHGDRASIEAALTSHGDRLVACHADDEEEAAEDGDEDDWLARIAERGAAITRRQPEKAELVAAYLRDQAEEDAWLQAHATEAIWVLERGA